MEVMSPHPEVGSDVDQAAVRALEAAYDDAWRDGNVDGVLACLAPDAVILNPRGGEARGHAEIRGELKTLFGGEFAGSTHKSVVLRVSFVTSDVAIVDGEAHVQPSDPTEPTLVHRYTDVVVRREGGWVIAHVRAYVLAQASSGRI